MLIKKLKKKLSFIFKKAKLLAYHSKNLRIKKHQGKKRIIICFNGVLPHGGLVDRLKGIVSFYEISKILEYDFYIQFDNPFQLDVFLEPNSVSWMIDKSAIKYYPISTKIIYIVNDFNINPLEEIKSSSAHTFLVYANIDYSKKMYPELNEKELETKWRLNFNELFKKSKLLSDKLDAIETDKYISIHTRFTNLMGDFVDSSVKTISENEKETLLLKLQKEIKVILSKTDYKCYVFSDSVHFLNYIKQNLAVSIVGGNPFHMDNFKGDSTLEANLKTLLDFFMIANSETVYFLKVGSMYSSSFSKYAAIIGDKPFKMVTE